MMDTMDLDVDMDVDVDLVPDEPIVAESEPQDAPRHRSPGEIDDSDESENTFIPNKIYIRGLDILNPEEVKAYVAEHFSEEPVTRIEWIDDSSANIPFSSRPIAVRALSSLASGVTYSGTHDLAQLHSRELITAKPFSAKPQVALRIRLALATDKKQAGAASRSRFYLLNPEYDPEERRRRGEARRYRERGGDGYGRRRAREARYREADDQFDVSLYDDDELTLSNRDSQSRPHRRRSYTPDGSDDRRERDSYHNNNNRGKELFPGSANGRNDSRRERSASPRHRDGGQTTGGISNGGDITADRNRGQARAIKSRLSRSNRSRELFPDKLGAGAGRLGDEVEDTTTLLAKGIILPLMDKRNDAPMSTITTTTTGRRLEDRITVPGHDRSIGSVSGIGEAPGFNIRGTASQRSEDQGFAIKGSAGKSAKELFPEKLGHNSRKELFADRLEGRSRQRQRAGDLFD